MYIINHLERFLKIGCLPKKQQGILDSLLFHSLVFYEYLLAFTFRCRASRNRNRYFA